MPKPIIVWFRRDFRLTDHAALTAAVGSGAPVIPVFILDSLTEMLGAAPKWRLEQAVGHFDATLRGLGSRLILRRGEPLDVLQALLRETGAGTVYWSREYRPETVARDTAVKTTLQAEGITVDSFPGWVLFEPWSVQTGKSTPYTVYTPYWRNVAQRAVDTALPRIAQLPSPDSWPSSDTLAAWQMGATMHRGASVMAGHARVGEVAALDRLTAFLQSDIDRYQEDRNRPDLDATSGLSENLAVGEISPRQIWHAGQQAWQHGSSGAETFFKELVWREFAWHLMWHTPHMAERNWRSGWDAFPWRAETGDAQAWQRGLTGEPIIDAGMRELYVTGRMHNRMRMITASYLAKHLLTDWRLGQRWFEDCLIDWDPAANAMGWQWVAGSGPDAAPYFRIFNPATQAEKFDPKGAYRQHYLEGQGAEAFLAAAPRSWNIGADSRPEVPIIPLDLGRKRALEAYESLKS
ncbi:cryptochrome/photolyase family protein [Halovulum sp. GXIMD14793]